MSINRAPDNGVNPLDGANHPNTSTITSTRPLSLYNCTLPSDPTGTRTMLATVWPAATLTFDANGGWVAPGHTVRYEPAVAPTAVTFNATEPAPTDGTPPRPATRTDFVAPGPSGPPPRWVPSVVGASRVSSSRCGASPCKAPSAGNHPSTSTATWIAPASLYISISPSAPTGTITMFGAVAARATLRLDAVGCGEPAGHTVI